MQKDLLDRINKHVWYHEFDFGDGVVTKSLFPNIHEMRRIWGQIKDAMDSIDFKGKTVLDVGCWDGYWSFCAEQRGASYVLATDMNSQRWVKDGDSIKPAQPSDNEGFKIASEIFKSKVEYLGDVSVYDVARLNKQFDIVLYLGVYYHLTHMMYAFTQLRHVLKPGGDIIVEGGAIDDLTKSYMDFYFGNVGDEPYRGDASNYSVPTRRCLADMLLANYFTVEKNTFVPHERPPEPAKPKPSWLKQKAASYFDLKIDNSLPPIIYGRALAHAKAVTKIQKEYCYKPLFGLDRYDPRFLGNSSINPMTSKNK